MNCWQAHSFSDFLFRLHTEWRNVLANYLNGFSTWTVDKHIAFPTSYSVCTQSDVRPASYLFLLLLVKLGKIGNLVCQLPLLWSETADLYGACLHRCRIHSLPRCTWTAQRCSSFLVTTILVMLVSRPSYWLPLHAIATYMRNTSNAVGIHVSLPAWQKQKPLM